MPYTVPTVEQFRARFPEFGPGDYPDGLLQAVLEEASGGVGTDWVERDYQPAILYLAAHMLEAQYQATGQTPGGESTNTAVAGATPKTITFGNRSVTFESTGGASSTSSGGGGGSSDKSEFATTVYGQNYLRLLRRNVVGVMVLNAS
jgi:hypothetical protein